MKKYIFGLIYIFPCFCFAQPQLIALNQDFSALTDKAWVDTLCPPKERFLKSDTEIPTIAKRFNWDTDEEQALLDLRNEHDEVQGNTFASIHSQSLAMQEESVTGKKDPDLEKNADYSSKQNAESFKEEIELVKKVREQLKGKDLDLMEWINEDSIIDDGLWQEKRSKSKNDSGTVVKIVFDQVMTNPKVRGYIENKKDSFESKDSLEDYLNCWKRLIRARIEVKITQKPFSKKVTLASEELKKLTDELNGLVEKIYQFEAGKN